MDTPSGYDCATLPPFPASPVELPHSDRAAECFLHDTATEGEETALEETYYHRLNPPQGFAFQRVYTDDRSIDEAVTVEDGDVVMVPRGYHPAGAAHGYDLYYLNVMAGPKRQWIFRNDPAHDWIVRK